MWAKMRIRLRSAAWSRLIVRFSPSATAPVRSSPSSRMYGGLSYDPKLLLIGWTMPFRLSFSCQRAHRSRSRSGSWALRLPNRLRFSRPRILQLRLTRIAPDDEPCLVSETDGACFVSVILLNRTGGAGGATGGAG